MTQLIILVLASLGSWEILRRLLPVHLPMVIGMLATAGIAYSLLTWAPSHIILALSVPGGLMLLSNLLSPEQRTPWGPQLLEWVRRARAPRLTEARPRTKLGNRIPRL